MQKLHLVGVTTDHEGLILSARRGARSGSYTLVVDDDLAEVVEELRSRQPEADEEPDGSDQPARRDRVESRLSVREVQARLRRGRSVTEVAKAAGVEPSWVERFAAPVLAEQAQVVRRVRAAPLKRARLGTSAMGIGAAVERNLVDRGVSLTPGESEEAWTTQQMADGRWAVRFAYRYRGREQVLRFDLDERSGEVSAADRSSGQLGFVAPAATSPGRRQATARRAPGSEQRSTAKRATVGTGFRGEPPARATSGPAKERERAAAAMAKAAAQRAQEAERATARRLKERRVEDARRERERLAQERSAAREALARERAEAKAAKEKADRAKAAERARAAAKAERARAAEKARAEKAAAAKAAPKVTKSKSTKSKSTKAKVTKAKVTKAKSKPAKATSSKPTSSPAKSRKPTEGRTARRTGTVPTTRPAPTKAARRTAPRATTPRTATPAEIRAEPRRPAATAPRAPSPVATKRPAPASSASPGPVSRPEPADPRSDTPPLTGAAADVYGPAAARALFRAGLVEQATVSADAPGPGAADPGPPSGNGSTPQPTSASRPRRTRPLRAT